MHNSRSFLAILMTAAAAISFMVPAAPALEVEVEIENFAFVPHGSVINVGDTIKWRNRDNVQHTSTSDTGIWNSGLLSRDDEYSFVFVSAGIYPYHCSPHPAMRDTIFVLGPNGAGDNTAAPRDFELLQNYPNPFNAQTTIRFGLATETRAAIEIYNIIGQKVSLLADQNFKAGYHEITWDAGDSPSGVYFYKITAPEFQATRRLLLLK